jgi:hypothetical protein
MQEVHCTTTDLPLYVGTLAVSRFGNWLSFFVKCGSPFTPMATGVVVAAVVAIVVQSGFVEVV